MNLKMRIEEQYPTMANEMYELILREEANFHAIPDGSHRQPRLFSGEPPSNPWSLYAPDSLKYVGYFRTEDRRACECTPHFNHCQ